VGCLAALWIGAGGALANPPAELLAPIGVGDEIAAGWRLDSVNMDEAGEVRLVLEADKQRPALRVALIPVGLGHHGYCKTRHYTITYLTEDPETRTPTDVVAAMEVICQRVAANEGIPLTRPLLGKRHLHLLVSLLIGLLAAATLACEPSSRLLYRAGGVVERYPWPLALVIVGGMLALQLPQLDLPFHADYMTQRVFYASHGWLDILAHRYEDSRHPQLYYLVLHGFLYLGSAPWIARLPAVLFSAGSAVALFALVRPHLGTVTALAAAALLGLSVPFLAHSRDVSDITLFIFLALLGCHLLLRCMQQPTRALLVAFAAVETAMLYTYYMAGFVVAAQLVVLVAYGRSRSHRALWIAFAVSMGLAIPVWLDLVRLVVMDTGARETARRFPEHLWGERQGGEFLAEAYSLLVPRATAAFVIPVMGLLGAVRWGRVAWRKPVFWLVISLLISASITTGLAVALVRLMPYYLLFLVPPILVLVVVGCLGPPGELAAAPRAIRVTARAGGVALLAGVFGMYGLSMARALPSLRSVDDRDHFVRMAAAIEEGGGPDTVIADPDMMLTIVLYHVFDQPMDLYRACQRDHGPPECTVEGRTMVTLTSMPTMSEGWEQQSLQRLSRWQDEASWFIYTDRFDNAPLREYLEASCERRGHFEPLTLYRCGPGIGGGQPPRIDAI